MILALPLLYIIVHILYSAKIRNVFSYKSYPTMFFEIAAFIKYCFLPILLISDSAYYKVIGPFPSDAGISMAIKITIYEMLLIYTFRYFYITRTKQFVYSQVDKSQLNILKNIKVILLLTLIVGLTLTIFFPNIVFPDLFFLEDKNDIAAKKKIHLFPIIISIWKIFTFLIFLCFIYKSYLKKRNQTEALIYSIVVYVVFLYLTLVDSRWSVLFLTFAFMSIIVKLYGKVAQRSMYIISPLFIILIILLTIYKFRDQIELIHDDSVIKIFGQLFASQLQSYFSGISVLAQSIDMKADVLYQTDFTFKTFCNDFIGSIPLVSKLTDQSLRTNYIFNQYVLGPNTEWFTQIIPSSGIGYLYMGFWLSPTITVMFNIWGLHYEKKMYFTSSIILRYIYIVIAFWMSLSICFNTQIPFGNVAVFQFPLYVIYYVISHLKYK